MTIEGSAETVVPRAYYPELRDLTHLRSHGLTPVHNADESLSLTPPQWHPDAACKEPHPDADWFAVRAQGMQRDLPATARAREICATCLVRDECRAAGLADLNTVGMWGGLDENDRRRIRLGGRRQIELPKGHNHGTTTGWKDGCACDPCTDAWGIQLEKRRTRRQLTKGQQHQRQKVTI